MQTMVLEENLDIDFKFLPQKWQKFLTLFNFEILISYFIKFQKISQFFIFAIF